MKNHQAQIILNHVWKKFCRNPKKTIPYGLWDIGASLAGGNHAANLREDEFWVLKDISLVLRQGEKIGIVGLNGSGKSTLLKILGGIFIPEKGEARVKGKVGALIAVGAGFHPMLTGRENIFINGAILGMTRNEIEKEFPKIVRFSGIGKFLDTQVKNYSSGMYVRLGFSVAVHSNPDILLVDEVLSVGDADFQKKSLRKMREISEGEKIVIFVSHNLEMIKSFTQKTIYMKNGRIAALGKTDRIVKLYQKELKKQS